MLAKDTLHIYTRVSTEAQEEKGTSLDSQRELGIEAANNLRLEYKIWNEGGASSYYESLENRPVLLELLRSIEMGEVKNVWVYNNDRLSRNEVTAQTIRAAFRKHNVTLYTKDGCFNLNNAHDNFMKTILDGVAAYDNAMRADRTRLGKLNRVKLGYWMGGPPPFGYSVIDKKLVADPVESEWVRKIYEWYADGKTVQWIKSELDKAGVKTNHGKTSWSQGSIQKILQNTQPIGHYSYKDSKTEETVNCKCPALVSMMLWNACQEKRKKILERKSQNNRTKRFYLLRNLLYCGHCGAPMAARTKESKNERLYYCPRREREWVKSAPANDRKWARGQSCAMTRSLNIPRTDGYIWGNIVMDHSRMKYIQTELTKAFEKEITTDDPDAVLKKQKATLSKLVREKEGVIKNLADVETAKLLGKQDERIAEQIIANLTTVLRQTEGKIEQINFEMNDLKENAGWRADAIRELRVKPIFGEIPLNAIFDLKERKVVLERLIDKIEVFYDKALSEHELKIHFRIPVLEDLHKQRSNPMKLSQKKTA